MKVINDGKGLSRKFGLGLVRALVVAGFLFGASSTMAQLDPGDGPTNTPLDSWSFLDHSNWTSDLGYAPVSFTNLNISILGDFNSLVVDTNVPAWLQYNVYENDGTTNLTINQGSVTFWYAPDWASTNDAGGGLGPQEWGRLFEVGVYTTNSSYGWWSLYVDPAGANLYFSAQTNDLSSTYTTYLSMPIDWTTNYFHFIALTYCATNTALYLDGVLATNGPGLTVYPGPEVLTNGFYLGSDSNGIYQAHGLFNTVATYDYPLDSNDVETIFSWEYPYYEMNPYDSAYMENDSNVETPDYGSNLWLNPASLSNNLANLFVANSDPDILYEIQGKTNLTQANWTSLGYVNGSELTNMTAASLPIGKTSTLFLRIRSWVDSTGTGIPDWWWLKYFGQDTNVDAYADPEGDGYSNLQKFQLGLDPTNFDTPPAPTGVYAYVDSTGSNVLVSWNPSPGPVTNYIIYRSDYDEDTYENGPFVQVGEVSGTNTSFEDAGLINSDNDYSDLYDAYEMAAVYPGGTSASSDAFGINSGPPGSPTFNDNIYITANLVRNGTGRWQVMFSGVPTNSAQTITLSWYAFDEAYEGYSDFVGEMDISTTNLTNGVYQISDTDLVNYMGDSLSAQLFGPNGEPGEVVQAGVLPNDAPYFVDGRQHLKQNLNFLIRAASIYQPLAAYMNGTFYGWDDGPYEQSTNLEEFSFLHHDFTTDYTGFNVGPINVLDDLWPFTANYDLANNFIDTTRTNATPFGSTNFTFVPNFTTNIPASPLLSHSDPYWILQPGFQTSSSANTTDWGVTLTSSNTLASFSSGQNNLFGLPFETGSLVDRTNQGNALYYQSLDPGGNATAPSGYQMLFYASWCPAPILNLVNYYFAPLVNPSGDTMSLPGEVDLYGNPTQPYPLPIFDDFVVTNQTPPIIVGTIGQPIIIGAWAKYSISNSSPAKYAYLGQYFQTNAFLLNTNGTVTTNNAGILSPYGEFFPLQAGVAELVTMPDIDTGQQGTNVIRIVSMNADANHDGTMDLSYSGPDQTSLSRPLRFWANDDQDSGDYGGNDGIPGQIAPTADGYNYSELDYNGNPLYRIHGTRDLVDFFPVYLNIGSLFQSNALSAGISITDTNWQFVLSQADEVLRFAYTDLTPTNCMNFLRDTNEARNLGGYPGETGNYAGAQLTTISNIVDGGAPLSSSFIAGIATNNQGIILVEAATNTTQPLVLTIYHGTNQIAQTQLYLSISGVEQMFRSKTLLLNPEPGTVADRLTDASVPNEPDTTDNNFVFVHGYNVLPNEARGVAANMFKRLYWSGSHAKFWAVTWEGADTKGTYPFGNLFTPDYHTNVYNAFNTAAAFATFVATLTNGPVVVAAHSLGNMVVLDALDEYSAPISQYFMLDAAVPMEAIDPSVGTNSYMVDSAWQTYSNRLYAANWHNLFTNLDYRSLLAWNGRLTNFNGEQVYNFYSHGEEVLREWDVDPPTNILSDVAQIAANYLGSQTPVASYVWVWQEKAKGISAYDWLLGSTHGGWKFNTNYASLTIAQANVLPPAQLQTNAFFDLTSPSFGTADLALYGDLGNVYAYENRNRILSDAIPALSLPLGANYDTNLDLEFGGTRNFDMQTLYENGWPPGRLETAEGNNWHHSDFHEVAYPFTYHLFDKMVTLGNLK
jgi:Concanavalin A-like lectin/glucanases superfamily